MARGGAWVSTHCITWRRCRASSCSCRWTPSAPQMLLHSLHCRWLIISFPLVQSEPAAGVSHQDSDGSWFHDFRLQRSVSSLTSCSRQLPLHTWFYQETMSQSCLCVELSYTAVSFIAISDFNDEKRKRWKEMGQTYTHSFRSLWGVCVSQIKSWLC